MRIAFALTAVSFVALAPAIAAPPTLTSAQRDATHTMFEHVINTPTVIGRHNVPAMAQYVADQFKAGGFPAEDIHVMPYHTGSATTGDDDTAALIVRWHGAGTPKAKPILLMGHMDVVEAKREDSTTDPFVMTERDGYFYGRGTIDMKDGIVGITRAMINLKAAGFKPKRDIVVLFTGDEETNGIGARNGASEWLNLLGHPEYGLNADGGGGSINPDGSAAGYTMQTAEKTFAAYTLTVRNHGGHADNALPQLATAMINCRIFPGTDPNAVQAELERVVADPEVKVTRNDDYVASISSPLRPDVTAAYTHAVQALHPNQSVFPEMS